uniref:SFRICE_037728 n=1 Tax=Spodoptera frugiperda TaxID=7108 RepID=A0A2H1WEX4_SPOFR
MQISKLEANFNLQATLIDKHAIWKIQKANMQNTLKVIIPSVLLNAFRILSSCAETQICVTHNVTKSNLIYLAEMLAMPV